MVSDVAITEKKRKTSQTNHSYIPSLVSTNHNAIICLFSIVLVILLVTLTSYIVLKFKKSD